MQCFHKIKIFKQSTKESKKKSKIKVINKKNLKLDKFDFLLVNSVHLN